MSEAIPNSPLPLLVSSQRALGDVRELNLQLQKALEKVSGRGNDQSNGEWVEFVLSNHEALCRKQDERDIGAVLGSDAFASRFVTGGVKEKADILCSVVRADPFDGVVADGCSKLARRFGVDEGDVVCSRAIGMFLRVPLNAESVRSGVGSLAGLLDKPARAARYAEMLMSEVFPKVSLLTCKWHLCMPRE